MSLCHFAPITLCPSCSPRRFNETLNSNHAEALQVTNGYKQPVSHRLTQRRWALAGSDIDSDEEIRRMVAAQDASHGAPRQEVDEDNLEVVGLDFLVTSSCSRQQKGNRPIPFVSPVFPFSMLVMSGSCRELKDQFPQTVSGVLCFYQQCFLNKMVVPVKSCRVYLRIVRGNLLFANVDFSRGLQWAHCFIVTQCVFHASFVFPSNSLACMSSHLSNT